MLNISIVWNRAQGATILPLLTELLQVRHLRKIYLLDTSHQRIPNDPLAVLQQSDKHKLRYMFLGSTFGYGKAHNIALRESAYYRTELHLVLHRDMQFKAANIDAMCDWMEAHPQVGQLMPRVVGPDDAQLYLAKRLPTPLDVFGRLFLPAWLMARRIRRYELRDRDLTRPINAPFLSGCFMILRTEAAVEAGLFDERYSMYAEAIDLTRTIHRNRLTLYYPEWTVAYTNTRAPHKNQHMSRSYIRNMCRYFNKWGWFFDLERTRFNGSL